MRWAKAIVDDVEVAPTDGWDRCVDGEDDPHAAPSSNRGITAMTRTARADMLNKPFISVSGVRGAL
jgi:hypothetical protein